MNKKNSEQLLIKKLYIKDVSFENFLSSKKFTANAEPVVDLNVKLNTTNIVDDDHELVLYIKAETKVENQILFILELQHAGVFQLKILDEKSKKDFIIEGGKILFPYARAIIANLTKEGGFNPLIIQPLDFYKIILD